MPEKILKKFGFEIRTRREAMRMERAVMAANLGVHVKTYAKWENGQSDPPLGQVIKIARILNIPISLLSLNAPNQLAENVKPDTAAKPDAGHSEKTPDENAGSYREVLNLSITLSRILLEEREENKMLLMRMLAEK